jgi:hypothetical protein
MVIGNSKITCCSCFNSKLADIGLSFVVPNQFGSAIGGAIIQSIYKRQFHPFTLVDCKKEPTTYTTSLIYSNSTTHLY